MVFHIRAGPPAVGAHMCVGAIYKAANTRPALVAWNPVAPRVSLRSHIARSAQPHCAHPRILAVARLRSYGWAQRRRPVPLAAI
jgi:hypothetical protein